LFGKATATLPDGGVTKSPTTKHTYIQQEQENMGKLIQFRQPGSILSPTCRAVVAEIQKDIKAVKRVFNPSTVKVVVMLDATSQAHANQLALQMSGGKPVFLTFDTLIAEALQLAVLSDAIDLDWEDLR